MDDSGDPNAHLDMSYDAYKPRESAMLKFAWSMSFAAGDLNDFTGDASFRGFDLSIVWPVVAGLHLGAGFGFNSLYEEHERQTYEMGPTAITGKLYRYCDFWSFTAVAQWHFLDMRAKVRPYAGLRVGVAALALTTLLVDFSSGEAPAGFLLTPEVGLQLALAKEVAAYASYQFNFSTASSGDFDLLSFSSIQIGLSLRMGG